MYTYKHGDAPPVCRHLTPMQIDIRNRDCGATPADVGRCTDFTPGPEPRQARYGLRYVR